MPPMMQAKLLRALESGRVLPVGGSSEIAVDVRVVCATHKDLVRCVEDGAFREDLYYRLAVLRVEVPPLRARPDDLPALVRELSARLHRETGRGSLRLAAETWHILRAHPWPGNVRELHATLARALLRSDGEPIAAGDLGLDLRRPTPRPATDPALERGMIEEALREAAGNVAGAALKIGWSRQKLYRRMDFLRIPKIPVPRDQQDGGTTSSDSSTFQ